MGENYTVIIAYAVGIILLYMLGRSLLIPMRVVLKLFYNCFIGAVLLGIINFLGGLFSFHIAFNALTAVFVGFLGIPGIITLVVLQKILGI